MLPFTPSEHAYDKWPRSLRIGTVLKYGVICAYVPHSTLHSQPLPPPTSSDILLPSTRA